MSDLAGASDLASAIAVAGIGRKVPIMGIPDWRDGDILRSESGNYVALRVREHDPRWKAPGWRVEALNSGTGDGHGMTRFIPDYLLISWRKIEVDGQWRTCPRTGGQVEERFRFDGYLRRDLRNRARCGDCMRTSVDCFKIRLSEGWE